MNSTGTPPYDNGDVVGYLVDEATMADNCIQRIKMQIQQCTEDPEKHSRCLASLSGYQKLQPHDAELPTRLVRVIRTAGGSTDARLEITTPGQRGSYATLSHRWSQETHRHRTLTSNLAAGGGVKNGMSGLSRLFQDAILICDKLDIEYIWIDSICIIQDDLEGDWKREALKLASYYQNSIVTIAATSYHGDRGYFHPRSIGAVPPVVCLPYFDRSGVPDGKIFLQPMSGRAQDAEYHRQVTTGPLLSRGWVFQEWILSRRVLCFTESGPVLHCQAVGPTFSDGHIVAVPADVVASEKASSDDREGDPFPTRMLAAVDFSDPKQLALAWEEIVRGYTATNLTKPSDKLIALAGIASEFGGAFDATTRTCLGPHSGAAANYACGLWLSDICRGLLWERVQLSGTPTPPRVAGFPTWSWASTAGAVHWPRQEDPGFLRPTLYDVRSQIRTFDRVNGRLESLTRLIGARTVDASAALDSGTGRTAAAPQAREHTYHDTFAFLELEGLLQPVTVHGYFPSDVDVNVVGTITNVCPRDCNRGWRTVSLCAAAPDVVVGYAAVEHPDLQVDDNGPLGSDNRVEVSALLLSRVRRVKYGALIGSLLPWHDVYNVLFVKKANVAVGGLRVDGGGGGDVYERVGSGKLFGNDVGDAYRATERRVLRLV
ncbi:hypothetical protein CkaCkLH20_11797 [Colletotrichum karsti]|uniref:Heterokaryon incompatibility domain-containing protein n=1 Tax=Colletotrichum karsti TaxID=1095194 RepID=A0A9P6HV69_9PEZI|nr:uncharacterized protein CkaCkLH20_11797 [Colletotrichum karsti]KAF9870695.1 hypothetical protein CkaCkLH20_11797 [Colletotrichum karsti]